MAGVSPRGRVEVAEARVPSAVAATVNGDGAIEGAAHEPNNVVSVQPPSPTDANARDTSDRIEASVPNAVAPETSGAVTVEDAAPAPSVAPTATTKVIAATHSDGLTSSLPVKDARFYREQGVAAYHNGNVALAIADFNLAIRLDPNFKNAYIDRGIAFYRISEFNRAFADIAQAMRIENSRRVATPPLPKAPPLSNKN
jgi:hypothetical protein